jgi:malonate transporter
MAGGAFAIGRSAASTEPVSAISELPARNTPRALLRSGDAAFIPINIPLPRPEIKTSGCIKSEIFLTRHFNSAAPMRKLGIAAKLQQRKYGTRLVFSALEAVVPGRATDSGTPVSIGAALGDSRRRGGALLLSTLLMSLLCLALRPLLARCAVDGPAFTSIFQGATRWQTYVALAVSGNLYGDVGLALASVAMVAIIPLVNVFSVTVLAHYASPKKQSARSIVMTVVRNPLIWACAIGLVLNVLHIPLPRIWHEVADALGRSSLAIGLLVTGAGLHLEGMLRPSLAATVTVFLKLILMPVIAVTLALWFGLSGSNLPIVAACSAVPSSSSAYVLARQMGGDAPLLAQIITLQTIFAAITMPIVISLAETGR